MLNTSKHPQETTGPTPVGVGITIAIALVLTQFQNVLSAIVSIFYILFGVAVIIFVACLAYDNLPKEKKLEDKVSSIVGCLFFCLMGLAFSGLGIFVAIKTW